jgi:hypothetical protein
MNANSAGVTAHRFTFENIVDEEFKFTDLK